MEKGRIDPKKESSFEIIPNSDDDDMVTASLYSSIESSTFDSLNSFYFLESITGERREENKQETDCNINEKQTVCSKSEDMRTGKNMLMQHSDDYDDTLGQEFNREKIPTSLGTGEISSSKRTPSDAEFIILRTDKDPFTVEVEENTWSLEGNEEIISNQLKDEIEGLNTENSSSNAYHFMYVIKHNESNPVPDVVLNRKANYNRGKLHTVERTEDSVAQIPPDRPIVLSNCCSLMKHGLRVCKNIRNSRGLKNLASGLKSSFYKFLNSFELEMNLMSGMNEPLKILITAETSDSLVIEEAFYQSLSGQVVVSKFPEVKDLNMPILPVGHNSALLMAQAKINETRLLPDYENNGIIVSTTTFISEVYPQRWQQSTLLCLEDSSLNLNLHNFSSTIPVPNDYILQAQRLTPYDYAFKDMGLAVTMGQAIGCTTNNVEFEENICGVHHSVSLKSAAVILAGMYSKYINRYVQ